MKLIIFILIVLIIAALLIRIILRSVNQHSLNRPGNPGD